MKVFVSYARADKPEVVKLVKALEDAGITVWWDRHLVPGEEFRTEIEANLKYADRVIVVWTKTSVKSTFVRDEADRAQKENKLIPIRLSEVAIPVGFGELHVADCSDSFSPVLEALDPIAHFNASVEKTPRTFKLSKLDRILLINQYEILSVLNPSHADDHRKTLDCLRRGYLDRLRFDEWIEDDLDPTIEKDVFDILEMHRSLRFGYNRLEDKKMVDENNIEFFGFDGNYEASYLGYTQHLLKTEGLYEELHNQKGYNSHWPMLPRYIAMLRKWYEMGKSSDLSPTEMKALSTVSTDPADYDTYLRYGKPKLRN